MSDVEALSAAVLDLPFANTAPIEWGDYEWQSLAARLERPKWTYAIQYGPEGEDGYSWVYDESGQMIAVMRTHDAQRLAEPRS